MPDIETPTAPEDLTDYIEALAWCGHRIAQDLLEQASPDSYSEPFAA
jgi:hypothetical protein